MIRTKAKHLSLFSTLLAVFFMLGQISSHAQVRETPESQQPGDGEISTAVANELTITRGIDPEFITVSTDNGIVTLTGTAENLLTKDRATRVASATKGVRSVINNIEVDQDRVDVSVATDVAEALISDPGTESFEVESSVENGVVTLRGTVDSWQEKELAATVAKAVDGVTGIQNNIEVNVRSDRSDAEIANEIESALAWNSRVDDELIEVQVSDGLVTLSGTVGSLFEKNLASAISQVAGVRKVQNSSLEVKSWMRDEMERDGFLADKTDEDVEQAIRDAFRRHPRIDEEVIEVEVNNGVATLNGAVTNLKTARAAAQVAKNTHGVISTDNNVDVLNNLTVTPKSNRMDADIQQDIQEAIMRDPYINSLDLDVNVEDGVVTLSGRAESYFEKYQADEVASTVNGVTDIVNNIEIDYEELTYDPLFYDWNIIEHDYDYEPVALTDAELESAVQEELVWSPFVSTLDINVDVENGVATLTGNVLNELAVKEATEEAYEAGVVGVINNLEYN